MFNEIRFKNWTVCKCIKMVSNNVIITVKREVLAEWQSEARNRRQRVTETRQSINKMRATEKVSIWFMLTIESYSTITVLYSDYGIPQVYPITGPRATFCRELFVCCRAKWRARALLRVDAWRPLRSSCRRAAPTRSPPRVSRWDRELLLVRSLKQLQWRRTRSASASGLANREAPDARTHWETPVGTTIWIWGIIAFLSIIKIQMCNNQTITENTSSMHFKQNMGNWCKCYSVRQVRWEAEAKTSCKNQLGSHKIIASFPVFITNCQRRLIWPKNANHKIMQNVVQMLANTKVY